MTATWTYLLADLRTGTITVEVPLSGVQLSKKLNDAGTFAGTLKLSPTLNLDAYTVTTPGRTAVYALRDGTPWWGGVLWTRRYDSTQGTVDLGGADWWSYLDHRKVVGLLDTTSGLSTVATTTVAYTATEQNTIAANLVALAQSHTGGNLGITVSTAVSGVTRDRTYYGYALTDVGQALRDLAGVIDGPDMMFDVAGLDSSGRPNRILRLGTPRLGQQGSPHVWEVGAGVLGLTWPSDAGRMATRAYATGDGSEAGTPIAVVEDTTRYADGWPLLETANSYSGIVTLSTLVDHAAADQSAAQLPVVTPTLTVAPDVPPRLGDYSPGDDCRLIVPAGHEFFAPGVDTTMRIVAVAVSVGDQEQVQITLNPTLEDVA